MNSLVKLVRKERTYKNIIMIVFQVITKGLVFFFLYRYLYNELGIAQLGIWSLVTALTSVSRIGELGLSVGVVKYVAQAIGHNNSRRAAEVVQTIVITLGGSIGILIIVGYPIFIFFLEKILAADGIQIAIDILPIVLFTIWATIIGNVLSGGLDGCTRMDLRSLIIGAFSIAYLGLAFF